MDPLVSAALIGAGSSFLGGLFGSSSSAANDAASQKRQYQYNLALQQQQQQWQENMWQQNNAYNSPIQQVQRLRDAGLNANLAYGSLSGNVAQQPSSGGLNSVGLLNTAPAQTQALMQAFQIPSKLANVMANTNLMESNADLMELQGLNEVINAQTQALKYSFDKETYLDRKQLMKYQVEAVHQDAENKKAQAALNNVKAEFIPKEFDLKKIYTDAQIENIYSEIQYRATDLVLKGMLTEAQVSLFAAEAAQALSNADRYEALKDYQEVVTKWTDSKEFDDAEYREFRNKLIKWDYEHRGTDKKRNIGIGGFGYSLNYGYEER